MNHIMRRWHKRLVDLIGYEPLNMSRELDKIEKVWENDNLNTPLAIAIENSIMCYVDLTEMAVRGRTVSEEMKIWLSYLPGLLLSQVEQHEQSFINK